jgi:hypothetical protein
VPVSLILVININLEFIIGTTNVLFFVGDNLRNNQTKFLLEYFSGSGEKDI